VTERRRARQIAYNKEHGITPRSVVRAVEESLSTSAHQYDSKAAAVINDAGGNFDMTETIRQLETEMLVAAEELKFEQAAHLRDQIRELKRAAEGGAPQPPTKPVSYKTKKPSRRKAV